MVRRRANRELESGTSMQMLRHRPGARCAVTTAVLIVSITVLMVLATSAAVPGDAGHFGRRLLGAVAVSVMVSLPRAVSYVMRALDTARCS